MPKTKIEQQYRLEHEATGLGIENYWNSKRKAEQRKDTTNLAPENYLMRNVLMDVAHAIENQLLNKSLGDKTYIRMRNVLLRMSPEEIAFIALQCCFNIGHDNRYVAVASNIASSIRKHLDYANFQKEMPGYLKAVEETLNSKNTKYKSTVIGMTMDKKGIKREDWGNDHHFVVYLGGWCLQQLLNTTTLFQRSTVRRGKKTEAVVIRSEDTTKWLEEAHKQCAVMSPQYLPMVIQPSEWDAMYTGGFLNSEGAYRIPAVRTRFAETRESVSGCRSMTNVYEALNALQATPYRINRRVLEVMSEGKKTGLGNLPLPDVKLVLPPAFWETEDEYNRLQKTDPERIKRWKMERTELYDDFHRDRSKRMMLHWQTWTAHKFKDFEKIYFVWNMDWRGRVYPVQQYLNPQADANGKALLEFATGKPLGEHGAYWLAVHGANCFGEDKLSLDDRVRWIKDHEAEILDSARNPLDGQRFWAKAEKPYMFLAFCFEWHGFTKEGNDYISHLPVNMDGSCSGLQHYSAMLRDEIGGQYVNLIPGHKPSDIYAKVANVSQQIVAKDVDDDLAAVWNGRIDRGIAKRNTMTWAYSATLYGFTDQLKDELRKRDEKERQKGGDSYLGDRSLNPKAAAYLAKVNMKAIGQVVVKAFEAMEWLQDTAKIIANAGHVIEWVAPSGMKVIQKYPKVKTKRVGVLQGSTRIRMSVPQDTKEQNPAKNAAGIAPNFIHSLDASHLVMTVNKCVTEGIDHFAMIHDSFGTHAGDVQRMNCLLREAFVEMYSGNVLEDFYQQLKEQLPEEVVAEFKPLPQMGSLDLTQVIESPYFFA